MFAYVALCLVFIACITNGKSVLGQLDNTDNVKCQALPSVVPVNKLGPPYFVILHRCQGGKHPLTRSKCVNTSMTLVNVKVVLAVQDDVSMANHTRCQEQCTFEGCSKELFHLDNQSCNCICKYDTAPKGKSCGPDMKWDGENCKCICNLKQQVPPGKKVLDETNCKFVCPKKDCRNAKYRPAGDNCRCQKIKVHQAVEGRQGSDNSNQGKMIAALVIGEFLFLYLIFDFLLYSKKTGLMYYVKGKCSSQQQPLDGLHENEVRRCLASPDESNGEQVAVCVHSNGNAKPTSEVLHQSSL